MIKRKLLALGAILGALCLPVHADEQVIGPFGGLNSQDNPGTVPAYQAQDMLNVDLGDGGRSIKKREGTALDNTFSVSTGAIHGAYKFFDAQGNEVRLWGQDTGLWASVAGASYVRVATGTVSATWQCTDYLGFAYCLTNQRDTPVKTAGTTATTTYSATIPVGTMVASTPERLLVAGVASQPQRLYYSAGSDFSNFTVGTAATSSSFEDITTPGSQITHIAYYYGRWMFWKDQSFGYFVGDTQFNLQSFTVSNTIGTFDNTDVYDSGFTWFRGTDAHFYMYDGANLSRKSRDITPTVLSAQRRKSASWEQTTQGDLDDGTSVPTPNLSFTISPGEVIVSSFNVIEDTSTGEWSAGTASSITVGTSSLTVNTNITGLSPSNPSFELGTTVTPTSWAPGNWQRNGTYDNISCQTVPASGSWQLIAESGRWTCTQTPTLKAKIYKASDNTLLATDTWTFTDLNCVYSTRTIPSSGITGNVVYMTFEYLTKTLDTCSQDNIVVATTTVNFTLLGDIQYQLASNYDLTGALSGYYVSLDNITQSTNTLVTGTFQSQAFNTGFTSSTVQLQANYTVAVSTPYLELQHAVSASGPWKRLLTSTGTNAVANQYVRYISTMTAYYNITPFTYISTVTVISRSTGTYFSAVHNAPALSAWSTFAVVDTVPGASSIAYYTRASTNSFTILSSTPAWVSQPKNAQVTASTGTYFQGKAEYSITAATEAPSTGELEFNWFEGNASDKMYGIYHDYAMWFSVSLGTTSTTNNRILKYDLINNQWLLYDIPSNGFLTYNTGLYIGDATVGKTYRFGGVTSDNNVAITSRWKSKDFFGASPFQQEDLRTSSWYCKTSSGTTLSVTYTIDQSSSTTYSINLYDSRASLIRHNRNFAAGTVANTFSLQVGDTSTNPSWECFAGQITYVPRSWVVYP